MGIGARLRELDDRVVGSPRARPPAQGAVALAMLLAYTMNFLVRGALGTQRARLVPGLVLLAAVLAAATISAVGRRRRGVPVADRRLVTALAVAAVAGATPALVPALRERPLAPFVLLAVVLGVMWLTRRLVGGAAAPSGAAPRT